MPEGLTQETRREELHEFRARIDLQGKEDFGVIFPLAIQCAAGFQEFSEILGHRLSGGQRKFSITRRGRLAFKVGDGNATYTGRSSDSPDEVCEAILEFLAELGVDITPMTREDRVRQAFDETIRELSVRAATIVEGAPAPRPPEPSGRVERLQDFLNLYAAYIAAAIEQHYRRSEANYATAFSKEAAYLWTPAADGSQAELRITSKEITVSHHRPDNVVSKKTLEYKGRTRKEIRDLELPGCIIHVDADGDFVAVSGELFISRADEIKYGIIVQRNLALPTGDGSFTATPPGALQAATPPSPPLSSGSPA